MKTLIITTLTIFSLSLQAQDNIFDKQSTELQRELDLMNFIKSDMELYDHYKSGNSNLKAGRNLGYFSLTFIGVTGVSALLAANAQGRNWIGPLVVSFLSSIVSSISGTIAIILHARGKGKIRDVMDYAKSELGHSNGELELKTTSNGIGLVYSF